MSDRALLIRCGQLLDVDRGELLADRRLLIVDGRVGAILAPDEPGPAPGTVAELDLTGLTVLPGLIDCHTHLIGEMEFGDVPAIHMTADEELAGGIVNAGVTVRAGFTTVRDLGTYRALLDIQLRDAIERGDVAGPRMACAGGYVTTPGGAGEVTGDLSIDIPPEFRQGVVRTPDDVRRVVRAFVEGGADVIKVLATGAVLTQSTEPGQVELDGPMLEAAVDAAARHGRYVAAHAHGATGIRLAIEAGVRSIEHGSYLDAAGIQAMLRHGTWLVPDVYDGDWIDEVGRRDGWPADTLRKNAETSEVQRSAVTAAIAAGIRLGFGTDAGVYPHGMNAIQFGYLVRLGMTPLEAIRSATTGAAELLGWSDRVGSLEPGRYADLVAVAGDPRVDVERLRQPVVVVKGGSVVRDDRVGQAATPAG